MKKFLFSLFALSIFALSVNATDIWTAGTEPKWIDWNSQYSDQKVLSIDANLFSSSEIKLGTPLVFDFSENAHNKTIEFKYESSEGVYTQLPGTIFGMKTVSKHNVKIYVTAEMLNILKNKGLAVMGDGFDLNNIWYDDANQNVTDNTVWFGFDSFKVDGWKALEIAKTTFENVDWTRVKAIRFCTEATGKFNLQIRRSFDENDSQAQIADQDYMTWGDEDGNGNAVWTLPNDFDFMSWLGGKDRLIVQTEKGSCDPFNFTAIELVMEETTINFSADLGQGNYVTTFSADYATKVPNGVTAYTAKVDGKVLKLTEITDGVVPANEGVLLRSNTNGEVNIPYVLSFKENDEDNLFVGTSDTGWKESEKVAGKTVYVLARNKEIDQIGFIKIGTGTVPANKAVLAVDSPLGARSFSISFDDSELTSVQGISENSTVESAVRHNVLGQRVAADAKGIVIVNGKKVLNN